MARPKQIEDSVLLDLIQQYFDQECNGNIKKLKASAITKYINVHGYPDYSAATLRRTPAALELIEELKKMTGDEHYLTVSVYQTIDAAALVDTNRSREQLISAVSERDRYYKRLADSAAHFFEKYKKLEKEFEDEKEKNRLLTQKLEELEKKAASNKGRIKELTTDLKAANTVIDTYVYPEIANELLEKEGVIRKTERLLKEDALETELITTTTPDIIPFAKSGSSVIKGLFDI